MKILVLGATGYVGGRLVPRLLKNGHDIRCLVRKRKKLEGRGWSGNVSIFEGDVLNYESLKLAMKGVEVVYYLIHLMNQGESKFESLDREAAKIVSKAADENGVKRIIYLGGLGKKDINQSPHLRSRHEVGDILRQGNAAITEFRAAVIVGSGSLSFEMIHHLVNRLPAMICPRWVFTRTQPIAIRDVLRYLIESLDKPESAGNLIDIGGPEVLKYKDMMVTVAKVLKLKRYILEVPVLTPRLSSYWVNLITPVPTQLARALIEGLRYETICENDEAKKIFDFTPISFEKSVELALARVHSHEIETIWTDAETIDERSHIDSSHIFQDKRELNVAASPEKVFDVIASIGGDNGWYYGNWLWQIRGFIDQQLGGVGLRRGRRHPRRLYIGDALDFWRVEQYEEGRKIRLRAEMIVWGKAWLEFSVTGLKENESKLTQTAFYYPRGLWGLIYWYGIYPIHGFVFRGLIKAIGKRALTGS